MYQRASNFNEPRSQRLTPSHTVAVGPLAFPVKGLIESSSAESNLTKPIHSPIWEKGYERRIWEKTTSAAFLVGTMAASAMIRIVPEIVQLFMFTE